MYVDTKQIMQSYSKIQYMLIIKLTFSQILRFNIVTIKLTSLFLDLWYRENNVSCMQLHFIYSALML